MDPQTNQTNQEISYEGEDLEALSTLRRYREWILEYFEPFLDGKTVEFGAGIGNFAKHILGHVEELDLVEPSPNLFEQLRYRFADIETIRLIDGTLENVMPKMPDASYQCVVIVNVLEHIKDDLTVIDECRRILKPGGHLLLLVPALPFLFSELDRKVGHYRRYEKEQLKSIILEGGMKLNKLVYFDFLGIWPWWLLNTLCGATTFNATLIKIYDFVFVPISRLLEYFIEPPLGKSLIAIATRDEEPTRTSTEK